MLTIEYAKNLIWCDAEHTMFECVVKYKEFNDELPAGVSSADTYLHIQELWEKGLSGEYGTIAEYVPPPEVTEPASDQPKVEGAQTL